MAVSTGASEGSKYTPSQRSRGGKSAAARRGESMADYSSPSSFSGASGFSMLESSPF